MASNFINKDDLVDYVVEALKMSGEFEGTRITKKLVNAAIDSYHAGIEDALSDGYSVKLTKFAKYEVKDSAPRTARNPQTGETMSVPASKRVTIKALSGLKSIAKGA